MGGDLGNWGTVLQKFEVGGTAHAYVPTILAKHYFVHFISAQPPRACHSRQSVCSNDEMTKKSEKWTFLSKKVIRKFGSKNFWIR